MRVVDPDGPHLGSALPECRGDSRGVRRQRNAVAVGRPGDGISPFEREFPDGREVDTEGRLGRRVDVDEASVRVAHAAQTVPYPLSVGIGFARCEPSHDCTLDELFERADRAMYEEKAGKRT